jgi:hypothetical protein
MKKLPKIRDFSWFLQNFKTDKRNKKQVISLPGGHIINYTSYIQTERKERPVNTPYNII